jgi:hypothetical protein
MVDFVTCYELSVARHKEPENVTQVTWPVEFDCGFGLICKDLYDAFFGLGAAVF